MQGWLVRLLVTLTFLLVIAAALATWLWQDRPEAAALPVPIAQPGQGDQGGAPLTATWLGVTTLVFDDGETQLMTDGFFSRPGLAKLVLDRPVAPDPETIRGQLEAAGVSRLAAVFPVHSHYDHAMDAGAVAQITGAMVLGSPSSANAARGTGLRESQIEVVSERAPYRFGRFTVTFLRSRHTPIGPDGGPPLPGGIEWPLELPAPVSAWKEGGSYSILIEHPEGDALVQGSAGFIEGALAGRDADVVFLGIGGLSRLGESYAGEYWREIVARTGARTVYLVHWEDFTQDYGEFLPYPRLLDDVEKSAEWLAALAGRTTTTLLLPPPQQPVAY